jgi:hypothetical protein
MSWRGDRRSDPTPNDTSAASRAVLRRFRDNSFSKKPICAIFFANLECGPRLCAMTEEKGQGMRFGHFGSDPESRENFFV